MNASPAPTRVRVRYAIAGDEQMQESFFLSDVCAGPEPGTWIGVVNNVLMCEVVGFGDRVLVREVGEQVFVAEVLERSLHSTHGVGVSFDVRDDVSADAAWHTVRSAIGEAAREADIPCEGSPVGSALLLCGDADVVDGLIDEVLARPQMREPLEVLIASMGAEQSPVMVGLVYDATWGVGVSGDDGDGWDLIPEPSPVPGPPLDPAFQWDPESDDVAAAFMAAYPLAVLPPEQWCDLAREHVQLAGHFQEFVRSGESWRVMMATANFVLLSHDMPLLHVSDFTA